MGNYLNLKLAPWIGGGYCNLPFIADQSEAQNWVEFSNTLLVWRSPHLHVDYWVHKLKIITDSTKFVSLFVIFGYLSLNIKLRGKRTCVAPTSLFLKQLYRLRNSEGFYSSRLPLDKICSRWQVIYKNPMGNSLTLVFSVSLVLDATSSTTFHLLKILN